MSILWAVAVVGGLLVAIGVVGGIAIEMTDGKGVVAAMIMVTVGMTCFCIALFEPKLAEREAEVVKKDPHGWAKLPLGGDPIPARKGDTVLFYSRGLPADTAAAWEQAKAIVGQVNEALRAIDPPLRSGAYRLVLADLAKELERVERCEEQNREGN